MKRLLLFYFGMLLFLASNAQEVIQVNDFPNPARFGAVSFVINGVAYAGLGEVGADQYPTEFYRHDTASGNWTAVAKFPGEGREYAVAFAVDSLGYVGLGFTSDGINFINQQDFYRYNPTLNAWTKLNDFGGEARVKAVAFVVANNAYIGSGSANGVILSDFWKYNMATDDWTLVPSLELTTPLNGASAAVLKNKAYFIGGRGNGGVHSNEILEFDPIAGESWTVKKIVNGLTHESGTAFPFYNKVFFGYGNADIRLRSYNPASNTVLEFGPVPDLETICTGPISFALDSMTAFFGLGYTSIIANQAAAYSKSIWRFNEEIVSSTPRLLSYSDIQFNRVGSKSYSLHTDANEIYRIRIFSMQGIQLGYYPTLHAGQLFTPELTTGIYAFVAERNDGTIHTELIYHQ